MDSIPDLGRSHMPKGNEARVPQLLRPAPRGARAPRQEMPSGQEKVAPTRCNEDPAQPKIYK